MSFKREVAYQASDTADAASKIKDTMVAAGWTLLDDQSANKYYILTSTGESSDKPKVYMRLDWSVTNKIVFYFYLHWDETAHTGTVQAGYSSYSYITTDDDDTFFLWVYTDKNFCYCVSKVGTAYTSVGLFSFEKFWTVEGTLSSAASSGSNVVLSLGSGEAASFEVDVDYQIVGVGTEGREVVTVNAVDTTNDTITVDSLSASYGVGAIVGQVPFPWALLGSNIGTLGNMLLSRSLNGTGNEMNLNACRKMLDYTYEDPDSIADQKYVLFPLILHDRNGGSVGYLKDSMLVCYIDSGYEHTLGVTKQDSGTATGGSTTTLQDTSKSWTSDEFAGKALVITAGTGNGEVRKITGNTGDTLTVDKSMPTPDTTTEYSIYDSCYRYFSFGGYNESVAIKEV